MKIAPDTVSGDTFVVYGKQQGFVSGTYAVNDYRIDMTPEHNFFPGEPVQAIISTGIHDITGMALTEPIFWQFNSRVSVSDDVLITRETELSSTWSPDVAIGDLDGDLDAFFTGVK